jgi:hypothetical protein
MARIFVFAMYNSFLQVILEIYPITFIDWKYVLGIGLKLIPVEEIRKFFVRRKVLN